MEAMRQDWSDDRIDSLDRKVDEGFRHVDQRFEQVDQRFEQIDRRFEQVDRRFEGVEGELRALRGDVNKRFESLEEGVRGFHRTLVVFCIAMLSAFVGLIGTLLTITLTQL
jgi:hypothetical protein